MAKIITITESNLKTIIKHIVREELELSKINPISWVKSNVNKVNKFFESKDIVEKSLYSFSNLYKTSKTYLGSFSDFT